MVGCSGTPLPKKLGIGEGTRFAVKSHPPGFAASLAPLPPGATQLAHVRRPLDLVVAFFTSRATLNRQWDALTNAAAPNGCVWVAWPKITSGVATDITEDTLRARPPPERLGRHQGLRDRRHLVRSALQPPPRAAVTPDHRSVSTAASVSCRTFPQEALGWGEPVRRQGRPRRSGGPPGAGRPSTACRRGRPGGGRSAAGSPGTSTGPCAATGRSGLDRLAAPRARLAGAPVDGAGS